MVKSNPIGIFDSGIGGLSLVEELKQKLPNESLVYLADKKNFPYGEKTPQQIKRIAKINVEWLISKNSKLIVVACNTATVHSINYLRKAFPKVSFVGMEPAVKPAAKRSKKGIIILSSPKAKQSKQLSELIKQHASNVKVVNIGSLELVKAVENQWSPAIINTILENLLPENVLKKNDMIVLGCTHFPLIKDQIQSFAGKNIKVIDSGEAVVKRIKSVLKNNKLLSENRPPFYKYYTTSESSIVRGVSFNKIHQF